MAMSTNPCRRALRALRGAGVLVSDVLFMGSMDALWVTKPFLTLQYVKYVSKILQEGGGQTHNWFTLCPHWYFGVVAIRQRKRLHRTRDRMRNVIK